MTDPAPAPRKLVAHSTATYVIGRALLGSYLRTACRLQIRGREHVPQSGPVLLVANHQSYLDIPAVASAVATATGRHVCFIARESLARSRFLAFIMRESGAVLIKRGAPDRAALEEAIEHLELGDAVAIFPEGTRSLDGSVGEFRPGALLVARRTGCPIVPVGVRGTIDVLSRDQKFPRPARVRVSFAAPVEPRSEGALERVRDAVCALVGDGRAPRD
ncbi:MAG: 1-acyl-sn-glycerol-3-phosphate acyltransferase [Planctomycetota bacterium]|nr:MAG: 1-acyl-sn-glycerol-3-phosphate acyltransferase [Planctomycetota bacterium]